jgi:hypothetical protein
MKKQLILALAVFGMIAAPAAKAEQHEIFTNASTGNITLDPFNVQLNGGYGYIMNDMLEITGRTTIGYNDSNASDKLSFSLFAGPRFNFGGAINDAYWVGGEIGMTNLIGAGDAEFGYAFNAGKRFNIAGNANYTPFVQFSDDGVTTDGDFSIVPIAFSFTW